MDNRLVGWVSVCMVGQWIVGVISFQKIFGLCGRRSYSEKRYDVTLEDGRTTNNGMDSEFMI